MSDLDELIDEAQEKKEKFSQAQQESKEVKEKLRETVEEIYNQKEIDEDERAELLTQIDKANYGKVREKVQEVLQSLEFDDEEKELMAENFSAAIDDLETTVEQIRNDLTALHYGQEDRDTLVATIYGKHPGMRKKDIQAVVETIDDIAESGINDKDLARILSRFNSELNVSNAEKIVQAIREEGENGK